MSMSFSANSGPSKGQRLGRSLLLPLTGLYWGGLVSLPSWGTSLYLYVHILLLLLAMAASGRDSQRVLRYHNRLPR